MSLDLFNLLKFLNNSLLYHFFRTLQFSSATLKIPIHYSHFTRAIILWIKFR